MGRKVMKPDGSGFINKFDIAGPIQMAGNSNQVNLGIDSYNSMGNNQSIQLNGIGGAQQIADGNQYFAGMKNGSSNTNLSGFADKFEGVASGVASIAGDVMNMSRIKDTSGFKSGYRAYANKMFDGASNNSLLSQYAGQTGVSQASYSDVGGMSHGERAKGIGTTALKGAAAGSKFGPWGALIGGVAGGIAGGIGSIVNHKRAQKEKSKLAMQYNQAKANNLANFATAANNVSTTTFNTGLANITALGGPLNFYSPGDGPIEYEMSYRKTLPKFAQNNGNNSIFALGGNMSSNGGNFSRGYVEIGTGGSHEENPNEGVQVGVDPQGTPNMVEEGEVIYKNYVFSKRLTANRELLDEVNLPIKYKDMSFADIASKLNKKFEELPNDPIAKRTLNSNMEKLKEAQEQVRQQEAQAEQQEQFDAMAQMGVNPEKVMTQQQQEQAMQEEQLIQQQAQEQQMQQPMNIEQQMPQQQFAHGGKINKFELGGGRSNYGLVFPDYNLQEPNFGNLNSFAPDGRYLFGNNNLSLLNNKSDLNPAQQPKLNLSGLVPEPKDYEIGMPLYNIPAKAKDKEKKKTRGLIEQSNNKLADNFFAPYNPNLNVNNQKPSNNSLPEFYERAKAIAESQYKQDDDDNNDYHFRTWMRHAGPIGATGFNLALSTLPLDTSDLDRILAMSRGFALGNQVSWKPYADYVNYIPADRNRAIIENEGNEAAVRNSVENNSNGNRVFNTYNELAADEARKANIGAIHFSADDINYGRLLNAAKHNSEINHNNSLGMLDADKTNAQLRLASLEPAYKAAASKLDAEMWRRANIAGNISQLGKSIGNIGEERYDINRINDLIGMGVFGMPAFKPQGMSNEQWELLKKINKKNEAERAKWEPKSASEQKANEINFMKKEIEKAEAKGDTNLASLFGVRLKELQEELKELYKKEKKNK